MDTRHVTKVGSLADMLKSKNTEDIIELVKTLRIVERSDAEYKIQKYIKLVNKITNGSEQCENIYDELSNLLS